MVRSQMNIESLFTDKPDVLHTDDLALLLRVSNRQIILRVQKEGLIATKVNNHYHFKKEDVIAYLKGLNESI